MTSDAAIMDLDTATEQESGNVKSALLRVREGDLDAFEELVRCHERLVFGTAKRLLGTTEDAEDAAQEVFLRLFRHRENLDPTRPLVAWLYRVTVNVCHTSGRRSRARPTVPLGHTAETLRATRADPTTRAELEEEHQMVAAGLESLARKERAALVLHDLEELSTVEVAQTLDISEVTVRTHLCRARQKMRAFRERWHRRILR